MLKNNNNYLVEFTQSNAKEIMKNQENYTGRLIVQKEADSETTYLEFIHRTTQQKYRFSLHQIKPLPKATITFIDAKQPTMGDRINMKCIAVSEDKGAKRPMMIRELDNDEGSSEYSEYSDGSESPQKFKGWIGSNQDRNNRIRTMILKMLQDCPGGNISPDEVRRQVYKLNETPTLKFIKEYMQSICEPSVERSNRKYILLQKYRPIQSSRKRVKQNDD